MSPISTGKKVTDVQIDRSWMQGSRRADLLVLLSEAEEAATSAAASRAAAAVICDVVK